MMWLIVGACGGCEVGLHGLGIPFGVCGFKNLWMRRAVCEDWWGRGWAKVGFGAVGVQCVRCGERGEGGGGASESWPRGGRVRVGVLTYL